MRDFTPWIFRRTVLLGVFALTLLSTPLLARSSRGQSAASRWTIVAVSGQVRGAGPGAEQPLWQIVSRGQVLEPSSHIRTSATGRATLTSGKNILIVDPSTHLQLPPPASRRAPTRVYQHSGVARYEINDAHKHKFQVVTPYLVAGVKGTRFRVDVTSDSASVHVSRGVVRVSSPITGRETDLHVGEEISMDARRGPDGQPMASIRMEPPSRENRRGGDASTSSGRRGRRDGLSPAALRRGERDGRDGFAADGESSAHGFGHHGSGSGNDTASVDETGLLQEDLTNETPPNLIDRQRGNSGPGGGSSGGNPGGGGNPGPGGNPGSGGNSGPGGGPPGGNSGPGGGSSGGNSGPGGGPPPRP